MNVTKTLPFVLCIAAASCSPQTLVIGLYDYGRLFLEHVTQANRGCDFDFCMPRLRNVRNA